jgi:hypothetical protein
MGIEFVVHSSRKHSQHDRSHNPWHEANRKAHCGKPYAAFDVAGAGNVTMACRTAVHRESDGITTGAYSARDCSRPYR